MEKLNYEKETLSFKSYFLVLARPAYGIEKWKMGMSDQGQQFQKLKTVFRGKLLVSEPLSNHTSFKIGGPAEYYAYPKDQDDLLGLVDFCKENEMPFFIIGCGTNLLVSDQGYRGIVIDLSEAFLNLHVSGRIVTAGAGVLLDDLILCCIENNLSGMENMSGIPGSVGGAIVLNAGAFGSEMKDVLESVKLLTAEHLIEIRYRDQIRMSYRKTDLPEEVVILECRLQLNHGESVLIKNTRDNILKQRKMKQPLSLPSAGSIFKRPPDDFAGRLIEEAGLKGLRIGDAMISKKHANFIVNTGVASASDVRRIIEEVQEIILKNYNVSLDTEIHYLGFE